MLSSSLCLLAIIAVVAGNDLYIMIEEISVYTCRGIKNEIKITEDDISVVNEKGHQVYYIHAPGNYSVHFKKIKLEKNFGYLAGELGVTLQVPIIEGPAGIRFDLPYTMIPETGILSQRCDDNSGIVERNGRPYCRYCDLCSIGKQVEQDLNGGVHQFLPSTSDESVDLKGSTCGNILANTYEFKKEISLPDKSTLEQLIKEKVHGVDEEVSKRLNKGRGRFQIFLNLITADKPSISQNRWFQGSSECNCCRPNAACSSGNYCNVEDCKTGWALQCLHNTARIAACYTVEFNYKMTTNYADVLSFLRTNNYPNQERTLPKVETKPNTVISPSSPSTGKSISEQCVEQMPSRLTHLRRYCTIFWNAKLCCAHCRGVCE